MCDFCNNIISEKEYRSLDTWDRNNAIIKINSYDYGLWIECDDYFYSGTKLWIKYCPMCGRKLNEK